MVAARAARGFAGTFAILFGYKLYEVVTKGYVEYWTGGGRRSRPTHHVQLETPLEIALGSAFLALVVILCGGIALRPRLLFRPGFLIPLILAIVIVRLTLFLWFEGW